MSSRHKDFGKFSNILMSRRHKGLEKNMSVGQNDFLGETYFPGLVTKRDGRFFAMVYLKEKCARRGSVQLANWMGGSSQRIYLCKRKFLKRIFRN